MRTSSPTPCTSCCATSWRSSCSPGSWRCATCPKPGTPGWRSGSASARRTMWRGACRTFTGRSAPSDTSPPTRSGRSSPRSSTRACGPTYRGSTSSSRAGNSRGSSPGCARTCTGSAPRCRCRSCCAARPASPSRRLPSCATSRQSTSRLPRAAAPRPDGAARALLSRRLKRVPSAMVTADAAKPSRTLKRLSAPVRFELLAVNLDQKQPGFPEQVLPQYLATAGVPFHIIEQDTYSVVKRVVPEGRTLCGLCSRLRRGALYRFAAENGITKIALGHHRDDIVETLFLNLFFGGRLKAMAPKLLSDDGRHVVIRPLAYVAARDIARYARGRAFPLIPCTLCGSQENLQRVAVRKMLERWERAFPGRTESIFSALRNVEPEHLADTRHFDFAGLDGRRVAPIAPRDACRAPAA